MAEGEFALMTQHLEAGIERGASLGAFPSGMTESYALLADAAALKRDEAALQKYAAPAEETARSADHRLNTGIAHRAWAVAHTLAGEHAEAEARLQQAMELFASYPAPWQIGRTYFEMGELARARNKTGEAREHYSRALSAFESLHAAPDAQRTQRALDSLSGS